MSEYQEGKVEELIRQLEKKEISILEIPEEYQDNFQIIKFERKVGLRVIKERGYDVIRNKFFVKEIQYCENSEGDLEEEEFSKDFEEFGEYYLFLDGDIYEKACYRFYNLSTEIITKYSLDVERMNQTKAFIFNTIDEYSSFDFTK